MSRSGNTIGGLYLYISHEHFHRLGSNSWQPKNGDICVCLSHTGDCFNNYVAVRRTATGFEKVGEFGAYAFGELIKTIGSDDIDKIQSGQTFDLNIEKSLVDGVLFDNYIRSIQAIAPALEPETFNTEDKVEIRLTYLLMFKAMQKQNGDEVKPWVDKAIEQEADMLLNTFKIEKQQKEMNQ